MRRIIFVDDDEAELRAFRDIVEGSYDCETVHWPRESAKLFGVPTPDIFVSDLYLPSMDGDRKPTDADRQAAARDAKKVGDSFLSLYADNLTEDKARLRKTMDVISDAYGMLKLQWNALGQSPDNGVAVLAKVKAQYPEVPFVFYSRKITPEDVIRVLKAGAADAIRKGALWPEQVLERLARVQAIAQRPEIPVIKGKGLNVNFTNFPD